jgi:hypothetical protein
MSLSISTILTEYHFALRDQPLPSVNERLLLDYVMAANGVFARGRRPGLEVCMPVSFTFQLLRGLKEVLPYVQWGYPKVPRHVMKTMLGMSIAACAMSPHEALFHLSFDCETPCTENYCVGPDHVTCGDGWRLEYPRQEAEAESVRPIDIGPGCSAERAVMELHSHHSMEAQFSPQDNEDEAQGFRVYAVIGNIFDKPEIRTRVGLFGHFWECSASEFFELPKGLGDCVTA